MLFLSPFNLTPKDSGVHDNREKLNNIWIPGKNYKILLAWNNLTFSWTHTCLQVSHTRQETTLAKKFQQCFISSLHTNRLYVFCYVSQPGKNYTMETWQPLGHMPRLTERHRQRGFSGVTSTTSHTHSHCKNMCFFRSHCCVQEH